MANINTNRFNNLVNDPNDPEEKYTSYLEKLSKCSTETKIRLIELSRQILSPSPSPSPSASLADIERFKEQLGYVSRDLIVDLIFDDERSDLPILYFRIIEEGTKTANIIIESKTKLGAVLTYIDMSNHWKWNQLPTFYFQMMSTSIDASGDIDGRINLSINMLVNRILNDKFYDTLFEVFPKVLKPFPEPLIKGSKS